MRIGILGTPDSPYVLQLQQAATHFPQLAIELLRFGDLQIGTGSQGSGLFSGGAIASEGNPFDALIVRSMPIGSLEQVIFRMDCLQAWYRSGMAIHNPPGSLEIAIDKWLCLQRLMERGIAVPPTICCQTRAAAMDAWETLGGDVLVKPLFGGEGRGILRASDKDMAWRMFGTLQQLGQVIYVQQFIEHFGYDIRVLCVGEKLYGIRRIAEDGQWRTNISQGSRAEPLQLTSEMEELALRSREATGGALLGVDLLPARDGRLLVLEVNAVPGWKGVAQALQVDIAKEFLQVVISGKRFDMRDSACHSGK